MEDKILELYQALAGGVTPAMATPIDRESGNLNLKVLPQLVDFLIERGVQGLFAGGTTGEGVLLDLEQRRTLHEAVVTAVNGRVPVIVHTGALQTKTAVDLAQHAAQIGADAMAIVTPIFYGIHDDALADYYAAIAAAAPETPFLAYDIPHMAVNGISPALAARMFVELPTFAGLKSSNRDAQLLRRLLEVVPEGRLLLAGNEPIALGTLALGASGMISGLATAIPEPLVAMTDAFFAGDIEEARRQQLLTNRLLALIPAGARIGAVKHILEERGVPVGPPLPPLPEVTVAIWPKQEALLLA